MQGELSGGLRDHVDVDGLDAAGSLNGQSLRGCERFGATIKRLLLTMVWEGRFGGLGPLEDGTLQQEGVIPTRYISNVRKS